MKKRVLASLTISSAMAISAVSASAAQNPFNAEGLSSGYQLASAEKGMEGKCGEGKCGANKKGEKHSEGTCGGDMKHKKAGEGKCGEGKCGGSMKNKKAAEGSCGGDMKHKKAGEGKCGEGKCGGEA